MINFKIGDIVTQNEIFYKYWTCHKFKRKIADIISINGNEKNPIIVFDVAIENVLSKVIEGNIQTLKTMSQGYLKIDITETRKEKLLKIHNGI
jgi:hypothetical protein